MLELTLEKSKSHFQISIGEEGAVVIYCKDGTVQTRLFVRTTEPHDTQKLVQLLGNDHSAHISLYLDTMDQSYVQRKVVGVRAFSANNMAKTQLDYEVPKNYLKTFISISRSPSKKEDWVYTFVAAAYEQPLYKWIEFFTQYDNIIEGIYFLPVEFASVLKFLRSEKKAGIWEVLICQTKAGGFRQSAFFDGKIIFSRILKNIYDADIDVMAGNIEQAAANASDHIGQLELSYKAPYNVYIILAKDIAKSIRSERIKADFAEILTPYQAAIKLGVAEMTVDKDRFFDPVFLAYAERHHNERKNRMHVEQTHPVFKYAAIIYFVKRALQATTPIFILFTFIYLYSFLIDYLTISDVRNQTSGILLGLAEKKAELEKMDKAELGTLPLKQISEIVDLDKFMNESNESPVTVALRLSEIMPEYIRVRSFKWSYFDPTLPRFRATKLDKQIDITAHKDFRITIMLETLFSNTGITYQELQGRYMEFLSAMKTKFPLSQVSMDGLPDISNVTARNSELGLNVRITYPSPSAYTGRSN